MVEPIQIIAYSSRKIITLTKLAKEEYGETDISNEKYLQWLYYKNPFGDALITVALDESEKLAGQYIVLPIQFFFQGKIIEGSLSLNTLIKAEYRGKGLFKKAAERTYQRCDDVDILFTVGVPNKNSFKGFINKLNFKHVGNLTLMIKPLRMIRILKSLFNLAKKKKGAEIEFTIEQKSRSGNYFSVFSPELDKTNYLKFLNRWEGEKNIFVHRSLEYLNWRYINNPVRKYYLFKWTENEEMKAFAVIRALNVYGLRAGVIMEFCCLNNFSAKKFLKSIEDEFSEKRIDVLMTVLAGKNCEHKELSKAGFLAVPKMMLLQKLPFIIKVHKPFQDSDSFLKGSNWHFSFGDYDIF